MGLSEFIQANQEAIVAAFQAYVLAHLPDGVTLTPSQARDHADQVLRSIAAEMRRPRAVGIASTNASASEHGRSRHAAGFDIKHVLGEYHMLRTSVMRLWLGSRPPLGSAGVEDLVRFNEAIDHAVAMSVEQCGSASKSVS